MALPLKSGADLYNQQAIRMRLHNLGADPIEVGKGLIYFNTNTDTNGSNHALHACVHDGSKFKALAYVEDVANNEEFLAVKRKVDAFFDGGVDADNVLENLAEVQKFLDNYSGATSLSEILDTKLDKSGGTITKTDGITPLALESTLYDTTDLVFRGKSGALGGIFINGVNGSLYVHNSNWSKQYEILDESNYSDYALPLSGGEISANNVTPLKIKTTTASNLLSFVANNVEKTVIGYYASSSRGSEFRNATSDAYIGITDDGTPHYNGNTLLHEGNVGDFTFAASVGRSQSVDSVYNLEYRSVSDGAGLPSGSPFGSLLTLPYRSRNNNVSPDFATQIFLPNGDDSAFANDMFFRTSVKTSWNAWQRVVTNNNIKDFTAGASKALVSDNGTIAASSDNVGNIVAKKSILNATDNWYIGSIASALGSNEEGAMLYSYQKPLFFGNNGKVRMLINSSGNVTIGASDLAGANAKLYVDGNILLKSYAKIGAEYGNTKATYNYIEFNSSANGIRYYGGTWTSDDAAIAHQFVVSGSLRPALTMYNSGNVLIGTTTDNESGAKLQVNGDISTSRLISTKGLDICAQGTNTAGSRLFLTTRVFRPWGADNGLIDLGNGESRWGKVCAGGADFADSVVINGDLRVTGNIIAEKQVSAKGKGKEAPASGGGGGLFYATTIGTGITTTSIAHNLGTENVIISIYEKLTISGEVVWNQIWTDIEIKGINSVQVTFGNETDVEHKIVIMGATA